MGTWSKSVAQGKARLVRLSVASPERGRGRQAQWRGGQGPRGGGEGGWQIPHGALWGHEDFDFYSEVHQEPLAGCEQRGNMFQLRP